MELNRVGSPLPSPLPPPSTALNDPHGARVPAKDNHHHHHHHQQHHNHHHYLQHHQKQKQKQQKQGSRSSRHRENRKGERGGGRGGGEGGGGTARSNGRRCLKDEGVREREEVAPCESFVSSLTSFAGSGWPRFYSIYLHSSRAFVFFCRCDPLRVFVVVCEVGGTFGCSCSLGWRLWWW